MTRMHRFVLCGLATLACGATVVEGQQLQGLRSSSAPQDTMSICGTNVPIPSRTPPDGAGPVIYLIAPCFQSQGGVARTSPGEYLRDIQLRPSRVSQGEWVPFDRGAEQAILNDFQRLWSNHRLEELSVDIRDYRFPNGVIGKVVTYNITERK